MFFSFYCDSVLSFWSIIPLTLHIQIELLKDALLYIIGNEKIKNMSVAMSAYFCIEDICKVLKLPEK